MIQNDFMSEMESFDCGVSKVVWVMIAIYSLVLVLSVYCRVSRVVYAVGTIGTIALIS